MQIINGKYGHRFSGYSELYQWSIENISDFWESMWEFAEVKASKKFDQVVDDLTRMPGAKWFSGARLNFSENLLRFRDDSVALIFKGEGQDTVRITYGQLYEQVAAVAEGLKEAGVRPETG